MDRLLAIMIIAALALGILVGYSVLYLYPYQRQTGGSQVIGIVANATSTPITIPLASPADQAVQRAASGYGGEVYGDNATFTMPSPMASQQDLRYPRIISAELLEIRGDGGKIYLAIKLYIGGNLSGTKDLSIARVLLTPLPFPYAWNGSSWVYGSDEERCLVRIALPIKILYYSYNASQTSPYEISLSIKLDLDRGNVYGRYGLSIIVKLGSNYYNISREVGLGGYIDPPRHNITKPPTCS